MSEKFSEWTVRNIKPVVDDLMKDIESDLEAYQHKPGVIPMLKESREELLGQVREKLTKLLSDQDLRDKIYHGFELIVQESFRIPHANHVLEEIKQANANFKHEMVEKDAAHEEITTFDTMQEWLKISNETLQGIYSISVQLMDEKRYEDAYDVLTVLTSLNHLIFEPWFVSGICAFEREMFIESLHAFSLATLVDPYQPAPHLYSAQIYLQIGHKDLATKTLQWALTLISDKDQETYKKVIRNLHQQLAA